MKAQFYSLKAFILFLFFCSCIGKAANAQTLTVGRENWTAASDGSSCVQGDILICTVTIVTNNNPVNVAMLFNIFPAGTIYEPGSTFLNGVAVPDINGNMPYTNYGLINGGTLAANTTYEIVYMIKAVANGGVIQYNQYLWGDNGVYVTPSNTVITTYDPVTSCGFFYTVTPATSGSSVGPFNQIKTMNSSGTSGASVYNGLTGTCYEITTSGTINPLTPGSLLTDVAALAYDGNALRMYFVNRSTTASQDLCYVQRAGNTYTAHRINGATIGTNITRMTMSISDTGYALNDNATDLVRFVVNGYTAAVDHFGPLITYPAGSFDVQTESGGDIFSDGAGMLYLIANSGRVYKIFVSTRVAIYLGTLTFSPANPLGVNSVGVMPDGNIYVGGGSNYVYRARLSTMTATAVNTSTTNVWANSDFASCGLPMQLLRVATNEKPAVNDPEVKAISEEVFAKVQPNPFHNELNLQVQLKTAEVVKLRLIDFYGRTVYSTSEKLGAGINSLRLPVPGGLATGMYLIELYAGNKQLLQKKLVKQ